MKPVGIFFPEITNPRAGGPSGFLAQNIYGHDIAQADFLDGRIPKISYGRRFSVRMENVLDIVYFKGIPLYFRPWFFRVRSMFRRWNAKNYKILYFHDVFTMYFCIDLLRPYQHVILQPHMPEMAHQETKNWPGLTDRDIDWIRDELTSTVFARADRIVLPNSGALPIYRDVISGRTAVNYVTSGTKMVEGACKIPLDPSHINLLFIGRRIPIKGFDILIDAFMKAHSLRPDLRLFLLGGGDKIDAPGIVDLGPQQRPHDWIASVDYVINANRQSYLDLSVLETISIGTPLVMSCTYGHDIFRDIPGIADIGESTVENLSAVLSKLEQPPAQSKKRIGKDFFEQFSDSAYRARLEDFLQQVLNDCGKAITAEVG